MRKGWKRTWMVLGIFIGLLVVAGVVLYAMGTAALGRTNDVVAESIVVPTDAVSLARGEHLATTALCVECHGEDLSGGEDLIGDASVGTIIPPNLTGLGDSRTSADLVRAIRHAVAPDGRQLMIMPSELYVNLSAEDLGALVGYLSSLPRIGEETPGPDITFMGRVGLAAGLFGDVFPAEYIDHDQPFPEMPEITASLEYGTYLAPFCTACHAENLGGGQLDAADPMSPWAPNLTAGGHLGSWTEEDFVRTMRTGDTPEGASLDPDAMPWPLFGALDDDELDALWLYLQSRPAVADND